MTLLLDQVENEPLQGVMVGLRELLEDAVDGTEPLLLSREL